MTKAICPKHEWGYTLSEGCPWCPPKPRTRAYRKGEAVTDVFVGMRLADRRGHVSTVTEVDHALVLLLNTRGRDHWERLALLQEWCTYAEDFEAPESFGTVAGILHALYAATPGVHWRVRRSAPGKVEVQASRGLHATEHRKAEEAADKARPTGVTVVLHFPPPARP